MIPGVLWDALGHDLTRAQVDRIPGAVPTVVVGAGGANEPAPAAPPASPLVAPVTAIPLLDKGQCRRGRFSVGTAPVHGHRSPVVARHEMRFWLTFGGTQLRGADASGHRATRRSPGHTLRA